MDSDLKISVVIPVYNSERTIYRCIDSVLCQTYPIYEIIIVDDGSTDKSIELIHQLKAQKNINNLILIQQENAGPSTARNRAISFATGHFIAFLDSDDWWLETKIEKQVFILINDVDMCLLGTKTSIEKRQNSFSNRCRYIRFKMLIFKNYFATSSVIINRNLLDEFSFNVDKKYSEDYDLWLNIVYDNKAAICTEKLTVMGKPIIGKTGLSSNLWEMEKGELTNFIRLKKDLKISFLQLIIISVFSFIKFIRRLVIKNLAYFFR